MWHWWYNGREQAEAGAVGASIGPETTITWRHLLRESKDPGDQPEHAQVDSNRWMSAGRPTGPQY